MKIQNKSVHSELCSCASNPCSKINPCNRGESRTAPVAMFVYNRLDNTRQTIEALKANRLAGETDVVVFSDGGRDEASWQQVRRLRAWLRTVTGFKSFRVVERPVNYYLERNIIEGIAEVLATHDRIIVVEDDIVTSPWFLTFMNDALQAYRDEPQVWHVAGFTNLWAPHLGDTFIAHHMAGWGWGTWRDRWQAHFRHFASRQEALEGMAPDLLRRVEMHDHFPCLKNLDRRPIPWDICWTLAIWRARALCVYPTRTLVRNVGLATGTHFSQSRLFGWYEYDRPPYCGRISVGGIPVAPTPGIEDMLALALHDHGMRYNLLGRLLRSVLNNVVRPLGKRLGAVQR